MKNIPPDLGHCYCCAQYYGERRRAGWLSDGYIPACDECHGDLSSAARVCDEHFGAIDENMVELDVARVTNRCRIHREEGSSR